MFYNPFSGAWWTTPLSKQAASSKHSKQAAHTKLEKIRTPSWINGDDRKTLWGSIWFLFYPN